MHNTYICVHLFPSIMEQKCVSIALLIAESSMNQSTFVAISDDEQISKNWGIPWISLFIFVYGSINFRTRLMEPESKRNMWRELLRECRRKIIHIKWTILATRIHAWMKITKTLILSFKPGQPSKEFQVYRAYLSMFETKPCLMAPPFKGDSINHMF